MGLLHPTAFQNEQDGERLLDTVELMLESIPIKCTDTVALLIMICNVITSIFTLSPNAQTTTPGSTLGHRNDVSVDLNFSSSTS
jgi:hypothetical protein